MKVIVKINDVEILVNARAEEVERIEIMISDENKNRENIVEAAPTSTADDETNVEEPHEPHYCNVNCSCKFNEIKNSK